MNFYSNASSTIDNLQKSIFYLYNDQFGSILNDRERPNEDLQVKYKRAKDYHGLQTEDLEEFETLDFLDEMEAEEELELMPEEEASLERSNEESLDSAMDLREVEEESLISASKLE